MPKENIPFTKVPNAVLEALYKTKLRGREYRVMLFIIRYTYGYQHEKWTLSNTFIGKGCDIYPNHVSKILKSLENQGFIGRKKASGIIPQTVTVTAQGITSGGTTTITSEGTTTITAQGNQIKKDKKKDIKKDNINNSFSPEEENPYFIDYEKLRKEMGL